MKLRDDQTDRNHPPEPQAEGRWELPDLIASRAIGHPAGMEDPPAEVVTETGTWMSSARRRDGRRRNRDARNAPGIPERPDAREAAIPRCQYCFWAPTRVPAFAFVNQPDWKRSGTRRRKAAERPPDHWSAGDWNLPAGTELAVLPNGNSDFIDYGMRSAPSRYAAFVPQTLMNGSKFDVCLVNLKPIFEKWK